MKYFLVIFLLIFIINIYYNNQAQTTNYNKSIYSDLLSTKLNWYKIHDEWVERVTNAWATASKKSLAEIVKLNFEANLKWEKRTEEQNLLILDKYIQKAVLDETIEFIIDYKYTSSQISKISDSAIKNRILQQPEITDILLEHIFLTER